MARDKPSDRSLLGSLEEESELLGLGVGSGSSDAGGSRRDDDLDITENREPFFNRGSGRFHDPDTGLFEAGSPPPDLDTSVDRFRAEDGQFKSRSTDLFDELEEVEQDSLDPFG